MNKDLIKIIDLVAEKLPEVKELKFGCYIFTQWISWYIKIPSIFISDSYWDFKFMYTDNRTVDIKHTRQNFQYKIIWFLEYNDLLKYIFNMWRLWWIDCLWILYLNINFKFEMKYILTFNISKPLMEQSDEVYKELYEFLINLTK